MKSMKKLVAALLVLTMVLALVSTAMAADCIKAGKFVKFTKNSYAYKAAKSSKKVTGPEVIVRKGSYGYVRKVSGNYAYVQVTPGYKDRDEKQLGNDVDDNDVRAWCYWFKTSTLKVTDKEIIDVTFSNGGNGKSIPYYLDDDGKPFAYKDKGEKLEKALKGCTTWAEKEAVLASSDEFRLSDDCKKRVEATGKVWMHKTPSLSNSYGKALRKGDRVTYRRKWSFDSRYTIFLGIKYKGKCLWVSKAYAKIIK